jgi:hypothetical protein
LQKGAEVADVAVVIDRRSAGVHAESLAVGGDQLVHLSRQRIEKAQSHRLQLLAQKVVEITLISAISIVPAMNCAAGKSLHGCGRL